MLRWMFIALLCINYSHVDAEPKDAKQEILSHLESLKTYEENPDSWHEFLARYDNENWAKFPAADLAPWFRSVRVVNLGIQPKEKPRFVITYETRFSDDKDYTNLDWHKNSYLIYPDAKTDENRVQSGWPGDHGIIDGEFFYILRDLWLATPKGPERLHPFSAQEEINTFPHLGSSLHLLPATWEASKEIYLLIPEDQNETWGYTFDNGVLKIDKGDQIGTGDITLENGTLKSGPIDEHQIDVHRDWKSLEKSLNQLWLGKKPGSSHAPPVNAELDSNFNSEERLTPPTIPENLLSLPPREAATALVEANRSDKHRNNYELIVPNTLSEKLPKNAWLVSQDIGHFGTAGYTNYLVHYIHYKDNGGTIIYRDDIRSREPLKKLEIPALKVKWFLEVWLWLEEIRTVQKLLAPTIESDRYYFEPNWHRGRVMTLYGEKKAVFHYDFIESQLGEKWIGPYDRGKISHLLYPLFDQFTLIPSENFTQSPEEALIQRRTMLHEVANGRFLPPPMVKSLISQAVSCNDVESGRSIIAISNSMSPPSETEKMHKSLDELSPLEKDIFLSAYAMDRIDKLEIYCRDRIERAAKHFEAFSNHEELYLVYLTDQSWQQRDLAKSRLLEIAPAMLSQNPDPEIWLKQQDGETDSSYHSRISDVFGVIAKRNIEAAKSTYESMPPNLQYLVLQLLHNGLAPEEQVEGPYFEAFLKQATSDVPEGYPGHRGVEWLARLELISDEAIHPKVANYLETLLKKPDYTYADKWYVIKLMSVLAKLEDPGQYWQLQQKAFAWRMREDRGLYAEDVISATLSSGEDLDKANLELWALMKNAFDEQDIFVDRVRSMIAFLLGPSTDTKTYIEADAHAPEDLKEAMLAAWSAKTNLEKVKCLSDLYRYDDEHRITMSTARIPFASDLEAKIQKLLDTCSDQEKQEILDYTKDWKSSSIPDAVVKAGYPQEGLFSGDGNPDDPFGGN